jgi:hypothetical protein
MRFKMPVEGVKTGRFRVDTYPLGDLMFSNALTYATKHYGE